MASNYVIGWINKITKDETKIRFEIVRDHDDDSVYEYAIENSKPDEELHAIAKVNCD